MPACESHAQRGRIKRWTNEELLLPGQVVDHALIAALCSEEGDEVERVEGCYLGAH